MIGESNMATPSAEDIRKFESLISEASRICIITHTHPDGDALGSTCALASFLQSNCGKEAFILLEETPPDTLSFITEGSPVVIAGEENEIPDGADLVICLDFNTPSRTGRLEKALRGFGAPKILIDHHLSPERDFFSLCISETGISSACELLYRCLMMTRHTGGRAPALSPKSAYCLMCGMTTDTNNFANSVFPSTLRMASELLEAGVDRDDIIGHIYNEYRENRVRAFSWLLSQRLNITPEGVAYIILRKSEYDDFDLRDGELEGLVNIPLSIKKVKISLFLREEKEPLFRVSIRSKKGWSANRMARDFFNGGGHECASGGKLKFPEDIPSADKAEEYILAAASKTMK